MMIHEPQRREDNEDGGQRSHSDKLEEMELRAQEITGKLISPMCYFLQQ